MIKLKYFLLMGLFLVASNFTQAEESQLVAHCQSPRIFIPNSSNNFKWEWVRQTHIHINIYFKDSVFWGFRKLQQGPWEPIHQKVGLYVWQASQNEEEKYNEKNLEAALKVLEAPEHVLASDIAAIEEYHFSEGDDQGYGIILLKDKTNQTLLSLFQEGEFMGVCL